MSRMKRRSASRSWVARSAASPGRSGATSPAAAAASRPTCSSSYVTTSLLEPRCRAASASSYRPTMISSATAAVGQLGSGSRAMIRYPIARAENPSIRPSWPPPMIPIVAPGLSGTGRSAGGRRIPRRYSESSTKLPLRTVYSWFASPSGAASTIRCLASAYASRSAASARSASRKARSSASSPRAGGITWRWIRYVRPSWRTAPVNIGRVGGNGAMPPWRPKPRLRTASLTPGMSSGTASMPRSTMFLPGSPGTAELPTCSTTVPGHADAIRRATSRATSMVAGSHGWNAAGRRSYGRMGRSDIGAECRLRAAGDARSARRSTLPLRWLRPRPRPQISLDPNSPGRQGRLAGGIRRQYTPKRHIDTRMVSWAHQSGPSEADIIRFDRLLFGSSE